MVKVEFFLILRFLGCFLVRRRRGFWYVLDLDLMDLTDSGSKQKFKDSQTRLLEVDVGSLDIASAN